MVNNMVEKESWDEWAEADIALETCIDHLKEMGLSKAKIRDKLVEKALEVCVPKEKPMVITGKMVREAIKAYIAKEQAKDAEILKRRKEDSAFPPTL